MSKSVEEEKPSIRVRFTFSDSPEAFEIDALDLTAEEQIMVEEFFNKPWDRLMIEGWVTASMKGQVYLAYLARRRQQPNFTFKEAMGFEPKTSEIVDDEEGEESKRPTKGSKKSGSRS